MGRSCWFLKFVYHILGYLGEVCVGGWWLQVLPLPGVYKENVLGPHSSSYLSLSVQCTDPAHTESWGRGWKRETAQLNSL
jgi:hypothetical protein